MNHEQTLNKILNQDEKVEHGFSIGQRYLKVCFVFWGIISVLLLLFYGFFGILVFLFVVFYYAFYLKTANVYAFTNKRVLIHRGLFSTNAISIDYNKITDVSVKEPFLDKVLFHSGSIAINTAGTGTQEVILKHIQSPYKLKKKLDTLKD
jgi:uncharacterized membrane protein YdbT with pleckstrin-like domain